ncbi:DNA-directed RNA polymerase subunit beta' [Tropheryma whipplei]|uniref:DNA-directed RNA polymerase subunit beta' n=1 Tax=Tropheryma whipplei TaxID=2039 RepID=UPI0005703C97|nr:DNA-directed RNA polymerase subunit beta' [Tropheryma whipplei]
MSTSFKEIRVSMATTEDIRRWSYGVVKKPETINYRTLKPEKDGLFGEQIFGPTRDWECGCGKYKRSRYRGVVCERCGVEVTQSSVRRERMGHIELAAPVTHIWYFKGVPSRLGYLLDIAPKDLDKVIYFAAYMVVSLDEEGRKEDLQDLENELRLDIKQLRDACDASIASAVSELERTITELQDAKTSASRINKVRSEAENKMANIRREYDDKIEHLERVWDSFKALKVGGLYAEDDVFRDVQDRYGDYFDACMGAEAIKRRLEDFDLQKTAQELGVQIVECRGQRKVRAIKRLRVVNSFITSKANPACMVLDVIPVIPPELRPMVQLDAGRFAASDLNDLYRRVINRNNRLKRLLDLGAPRIIVNNEKRMLQEAVDALFDNGRRGRPVSGTNNRTLKSLSDMLKGKSGRFRQNLLGKRVDYSGRSVIVVGPTLQLHQCGLPKLMALELFKPFIVKRLLDLALAPNIRSARRMIERGDPAVWDMLDAVIKARPVLLNRAPTLHRLGIQAFEPQLVEGKAIQLHPLVCAAFNADFDGDQMAVHLPLSLEAQAEARVLMLASNNILNPSDGRPVTLPSHDMIIGLYHLTTVKPSAKGAGRAFSSVAEAIMAKDRGDLSISAPVKILFSNIVLDGKTLDSAVVETTLGRAIFNEALPDGHPYINELVDKQVISSIINNLAEVYSKVEVANTLDKIKSVGFHWATRSGVTVAISDVVSPPEKQEIISKYEAQARGVQQDFEIGLLTDLERRQALVSIWSEATDRVAEAMRKCFPDDNTINTMVTSGARGNWLQVRNIAGMRGLVANPKGETIPRPIISSYREGLSVTEYFISTHGARKGLVDTALKTADSGYLTRRLVDVAQDVVVRERDCGFTRGVRMPVTFRGDDGELHKVENAEHSVYGRTLAGDVKTPDDNLIAKAGEDISGIMIDSFIAAGVESVEVRSVLTCRSKVGVCSACYGRSLATGARVDIGDAVGIVAAQSIGEPGTQLTMRTFHSGGSASAVDITQGLPRVQELFEARTPRAAAPIAEADGTVSIEDGDRARRLILKSDNNEEFSYTVLKRAQLRVKDGSRVSLGDQLVEGSLDPKEVLRVKGIRAVQEYLVNGVQQVYRSQGVPIHNKHIEVIVRQMLRKVTVVDHGDTSMLPGELIDQSRYQELNREAQAEGRKTASARQEVTGITKASLATESWLSAASFQETTRVLTQAVISGRRDPLIGLKENVIIGNLIPAGTGLSVYRDVEPEPRPEAISRMYPTRRPEIENLLEGDSVDPEFDFSSLTQGLELPDDYPVQ